MDIKVDNSIRISTSINTGFFRLWLDTIQPFHNFTSRQKDIAAAMLKKRYELSKRITDTETLDKVSLSVESKKEVVAELGVTSSFFNVVFSVLKARGFVKNGRINPKFIPNIKPDAKNFTLLFYFELTDSNGT